MSIERGRHAIWISKDKEKWTLIGVKMDSLATNLNPDVNNSKDVTGAAYVDHNGFSPENDVEYKPNTTDSIYDPVMTIITTLAKDEETCTFYKIEAWLDIEVAKTTGTVSATSTHAFMVPVIAVPQDAGGDTSAFTTNVNFYENGTRTQGSVTVADKQPTFTEASE